MIVRGQSSSAGIGMVAEMVAQHQECHWLMCGAMSLQHGNKSQLLIPRPLCVSYLFMFAFDL